jgi:tRNA (guanine37-N1)-methyltransferase
MHLFRPPVLRSATSLNRALFSKTVNIAAARVKDNKNIARFRKALVQGREILTRERTAQIIPDPDQSLAAQGRKCILLDPKVTPDGKAQNSSFLCHDNPSDDYRQSRKLGAVC